MLYVGYMSKRPKNYNLAELQPDEINSLRSLVKEFITKIESVDNEIELLKTDMKEIIEEYQDKLDMKTLQAALRVVKIQQGVEHKDTYDLFLEALTGVEVEQ
jgi:uncharacterized protein (UPF0335 family)